MGIPGLLQFIKDASEPVHVKKYRGQTVAVDTYCWLHKGAFSCAEKLAKGEPTDQYVTYCLKFVEMLLSFNVKPILVFDGCNLPSKHEVDKARRERRQANLQKGKQLLREGKLSEARDCFTRCVNITPSMAHDVIKAARARGVDCVVAPYEADAQLAFLNKCGVAQAVITEDSDLLAFGCKKVILKMDKQGNGLEVDQRHLGRCRPLGDVFTEEKFRYMCILSGCDYLASLYGIGLGKACRLLKVANNPDILKVIKKMGQYLKMSVVVPDEYVEGFVKANNTFLYQLVFDPLRRKVVPLNPYPEHVDPASLSYAGHNIGDEKGFQMALGNLDINTMQRIDDFNPDKPSVKPCKPRSRSWNSPPASSSRPAASSSSIWSQGYTAGTVAAETPARGAEDSPILSTRGQERVVRLLGLRLPQREQQVKRPREEGVSDQDVLQQYSCQKRVRSEEQRSPAPPCASTPRQRNRFATLLQRRNQEAEPGDQDTHSRFFAASCEPAGDAPEAECTPPPPAQNTSLGPPSPAEEAESDGPDTPSLDTPSPPPSPRPASYGLGAFRWSGARSSSTSSFPSTPTTTSSSFTSSLAALQRFHRQPKRQTSSRAGEALRSSPGSPLSCRAASAVDRDSPPASPPSQDSAYFSQSQPQEAPATPAPSSPARTQEAQSSTDHVGEEVTSHLGSERSHTASPQEDGRPSVVRAKVSGLPRIRPGERVAVAKVRASAPARASGLRKKPGRKAPPSNNENSPGLQATISSLWKSFGFKRESQNVSARQKGKPMSPLKDNLPSPPLQTDQDLDMIGAC